MSDFRIQQKEFLAELANVMEKHDVELRVEDHGVFLEPQNGTGHFYFKAVTVATRADDIRKLVYRLKS